MGKKNANKKGGPKVDVFEASKNGQVMTTQTEEESVPDEIVENQEPEVIEKIQTAEERADEYK